MKEIEELRSVYGEIMRLQESAISSDDCIEILYQIAATNLSALNKRVAVAIPATEETWENMNEEFKSLYPIPPEDFGKDLIGILSMMLGYEESEKNYITVRMGTNTLRKYMLNVYQIDIAGASSTVAIPEAAEKDLMNDPFIKKHLARIWEKMKEAKIEIYIKPMFDSLSAASIKYFLETGTINGNFEIALNKMMDSIRNWGAGASSQKEEIESLKLQITDLEKLLREAYERI